MYHDQVLANEYARLTQRLQGEPYNPQLYVQRGMTAFKRGRITASIDDFDQAERLNPALTPYLWQRGLAYYYAERFADGAQQFETDLTVNGHDVEETVWRYLCQARLQGAEAAREALLPVHTDPRPVMGWVYRLFAGQCEVEEILTQYRKAGRWDVFYSQLYVGLYWEVQGEAEAAHRYITEAASMQVVDDYMGWVAMVHQHLRGWS